MLIYAEPEYTSASHRTSVAIRPFGQGLFNSAANLIRLCAGEKVGDKIFVDLQAFFRRAKATRGQLEEYNAV